jgi:hypothetical protein
MSALSTPERWMASIDVDWGDVRPWIAVFVLEIYAVIAYFQLTGAAPTAELRYLLYPLVWMTVAVWAILSVDLEWESLHQTVLASAMGVVYFLGLLWIPGNLGLGVPGSEFALRTEMYSPGWGPLVVVNGPWFRLFLVPFEVIGYAGLTYLVIGNILQLSRGTLSGALGLLTCVGCTVPVLVPLVGLLGGPATSLTTTAYAYSYDIGTLLFVSTVALLYFGSRP